MRTIAWSNSNEDVVRAAIDGEDKIAVRISDVKAAALADVVGQRSGLIAGGAEVVGIGLGILGIVILYAISQGYRVKLKRKKNGGWVLIFSPPEEASMAQSFKRALFGPVFG